MLWLLSMSRATWPGAFVADEVEVLRDAVFQQREVGGAQIADEMPLPVVHAGFEQHARHFRRFRYLVGLEHNRGAALSSLEILASTASSQRSNGLASSHSAA